MKKAHRLAMIVACMTPLWASSAEWSVRKYQSGGCNVSESISFRIFQKEGFADAALIDQLESHRASLQVKWLGGGTGRSWDPKCDIHIHATPEEFQQATKRSPDMLASTLLEIGEGRVWRRQVAIRGDIQKNFTPVILHEVTHVVLADVFRDFQVPRWLDEGIAVAEEQSDRRANINRQLLEAVEVSRHSDLIELMTMAQFPVDRTRSDVMYAQSASLVEFLLTKKSPVALVSFAKACRHLSVEESLRRHFGFNNAQEAERAWLEWTINTAESSETAVVVNQ
ncbi:hypothetical protein K2X85_19665 [bacterium]|nr:hypothetical protein [bacterium]